VSQTYKVKEIRLIIGIVKCETKGKKCNTESEVISMLEFRIDNIFVEFRGEDCKKIMGMPKGTKCVSLLSSSSFTPMRQTCCTKSEIMPIPN
jgi:hypothetical protein